MEKWWEQYKVDVPDGQSGDWRVEKFSVSEEEASFQNMRASFSFSCRGQHIYAGDYTRLCRGNTTVMSDVPSEIRDHLGAIQNSKGNVLIVGLGLGMVADACLRKSEVEHLTVVELSPDVIHLVGDHLTEKFGDRVDVIQSDIFDWKPPKGVRYDLAWFDIWDDLCGDNVEGMSKLKRRFGRRADWKGCWGEDVCRRANREWKRQEREMEYWRR